MQTLGIHHDLIYASHPRGTLDVYAPADAEQLPVVVFVHGGALIYGDKSLVAHVGVRLARAGFVTVAINHRFSPAVRHPEHVEDAARAVRWVTDRIAQFGGDPDRIVLAGHSSGGYLAAQLGVDRRWLEAAGVARERIVGLAPISGFFFVDRLAPTRPAHVWGEAHADWVDASPAHRVKLPTPPTLLLYADGDDDARRAENTDFARRLEALGATDVAIEEIERRDHQSIFFLLGSAEDRTTAALIEFLDRVTAVP